MCVAFSPDSQLVASGSKDDTVRVWNCNNGACAHVLRGHELPVESVAFSSDGQLVASSSFDETVRPWRCSDGACVQVLD